VADTAENVLVVDDDPTVREVLSLYLRRDGYRVTEAADGPRALEQAAGDPPRLVVLDLMLPGLSGLEVFRRLRSQAEIPVIILTARGEEADRVAGLEIGADDYVAKPFSPRELAARVTAVLRRSSPRSGQGGDPAQPTLFELSDLRVDTAARRAWRHGSPVALTVREFDLLAHLVRHPGRAFRREQLLAEVWGYSYGGPATVTVHIRRLREKLEADPRHPRHILTVWGFGYRFEP
jgi:DNA-binding response OmpR family regulator